MLMGLVTKNAILLVDFTNHSRRAGMPRDEAILASGQVRLRPILMTTTAMIGGMLPLALAFGAGSEQQSPMAHAVIMAAASLANAYKAKLTLVHVVESANAAWEVTLAEYRQAMIESGEAMLLKLKHEMNLVADIRVVEDMVAPGLSKVAKEVEADLMVVGRGHSQDWMARFTSRLYAIVRDAPCPVLSI